MVFLVLMYDTAARCQEMLDLRIQDLVLHRTSPCVYFTGKGNKTRVVPILPKTAEHLRSYLKKFHPAENRKRDDYVFYAYGGPQRPMSPDTVAAFVKKYGESARHVCTSIPNGYIPTCCGTHGQCTYTKTVFHWLWYPNSSAMRRLKQQKFMPMLIQK